MYSKPTYLNDIDGLVIYARPSRKGDLEERQVGRLLQHLRDHGVPDDKLDDVPIYTDDAHTWRVANRPGLDKLLDDVREGWVRTILLNDLERLGRGGIMWSVLDVLADNGVTLVVHGKVFNVSFPTDKLAVRINQAVGEYERQILSERTRAGLRARRKRMSASA